MLYSSYREAYFPWKISVIINNEKNKQNKYSVYFFYNSNEMKEKLYNIEMVTILKSPAYIVENMMKRISENFALT